MRTFAQKPNATQQVTPANCTIRSRAHLTQSRDVNLIYHLQRVIGNQAILRLRQSSARGLNARLTGTVSPHFGLDFGRIPVSPPREGAIQTKLAISTPGDEYEREADRIAEQVMRMPEPHVQRACACGGKCPKCQKERPGQELERLQTKRVQASDTGQIAIPPIVHEVLAAPGQLLDPATRAFMEPRFGHSFADIRVHADIVAGESARAIGALAYVSGTHVVFAPGQYTPGSDHGLQLLGHELAHTVQQSAPGTGPVPLIRRKDAPTGSASKGADLTKARAETIALSSNISGRFISFTNPVSQGMGVDDSFPSSADSWNSKVASPIGDAVDVVADDASAAANLLDRANVGINIVLSRYKLDSPTTARALSLRSALLIDLAQLASPAAAGQGAPGLEPQISGQAIEAGTIADMLAQSGPTGPACGPGTSNPFCLPGPRADDTSPCVPYPTVQQALAVWAHLSSAVPTGAAAFTGCVEVSPVWNEYFNASSRPFGFRGPISCVVTAAKIDSGGSVQAAAAVKNVRQQIALNVSSLVAQVPLQPLPPPGGPLGVLTVPVSQAVVNPQDLHFDIDYVEVGNAAANLVGSTGRHGQGSDIFGDDDRELMGSVTVTVLRRNLITGDLEGYVVYRPRMHVKDTVDFCPGNIGSGWLRTFTVPMSKLEVMGLTRDVPITIDYDLDRVSFSFAGNHITGWS